MPKKFKSWADNFIKEDNTPSEPQKRPGTCFNCGYGSFTLEIDKNVIPGKMKRICKSCFETINPDTGEKIMDGETNE
jgi:hypothetical protein